MTYNYTDFDLSAFINNSPMQSEPAPIPGGSHHKAYSPALEVNDSTMLNGTNDGVVVDGGNDFGIANNWPGSTQSHTQQASISSQQQQPSSMPGSASDFPMDAHPQTIPHQGKSATATTVPNRSEIDYSSRIAAHHSHQLHLAVPVPPTSTPDGRLPGAIRSNSSTSIGRRALEPPAAPRLSLQERRRNARRALNQQQQAHAQAQAQQQATVAPTLNDAIASATLPTSSGINTSGRSAKRGMTASSGHIHGPKSTAEARGLVSNDRPPFQTQTSNTQSVLSEKNATTALKRNTSQHKLSVHPAVASRQAYSATGFDLLGALARVVLRPNPRILLGPVDLSASFTVCDARHPEQPIVYCSDTFCELTGYSRSEILGRNCRFLQAPDGRVRGGSERYHTDNAAVLHLKHHSRAMQECQASLINYRKDGTPFINLVTIVPIPWGDSTEPVFLVGFQVDLVEQPSAVLQRAANGTYVVNYSSGLTQQQVPVNSVEATVPLIARDYEQEAAAREVSIGKELAEILGGGKEDSSQWARILLQHSQDLIHVLSLKGTFLYVSPSVERLLGWKPEELIGKSISDFCHPSDVVPVFRELKDSTSNASINAAAKRSFRADGITNRATKGGVGQGGPEVNLLMRMKHKINGHIWVESKGKLHLEQGKGRKVVISSGRSRPVYNLPWEPVKATVSNDQPAFWAKVSNDGLVLSATEGVEAVIEGTDCSRLYGRHLHQMVNKEAMPALLEALRGVQVATVVHQMYNAIDEPVWVTSTMYPSAVMPGAHTIPTVFVHVGLILPDSESFGLCKKNTVEAKEASLVGIDANADSGAVPGSSVFGELATHRPSSHIFELHSLKHANRRLREDVRSAQRRVCARQGVEQAESLPLLQDQTDSLAHPTAPLKEDFVKALEDQQNSSGSGSGSRTGGNDELQVLSAAKLPLRTHLAPPRPLTTSSSSSSVGGVGGGSTSGSACEGGMDSAGATSSSASFPGVGGRTSSGGNSSEDTAPTSIPSSAGDSSDASDPQRFKKSLG